MENVKKTNVFTFDVEIGFSKKPFGNKISRMTDVLDTEYVTLWGKIKYFSPITIVCNLNEGDIHTSIERKENNIARVNIYSKVDFDTIIGNKEHNVLKILTLKEYIKSRINYQIHSGIFGIYQTNNSTYILRVSKIINTDEPLNLTQNGFLIHTEKKLAIEGTVNKYFHIKNKFLTGQATYYARRYASATNKVEKELFLTQYNNILKTSLKFEKKILELIILEYRKLYKKNVLYT